VGHVLGDVRDRGELVQRPVDADGADGRALQGREQDAPERVAEGDAEAALERLSVELAVARVQRLTVDEQVLRTNQITPIAMHYQTPVRNAPNALATPAAENYLE